MTITRTINHENGPCRRLSKSRKRCNDSSLSVNCPKVPKHDQSEDSGILRENFNASKLKHAKPLHSPTKKEVKNKEIDTSSSVLGAMAAQDDLNNSDILFSDSELDILTFVNQGNKNGGEKHVSLNNSKSMLLDEDEEWNDEDFLSQIDHLESAGAKSENAKTNIARMKHTLTDIAKITPVDKINVNHSNSVPTCVIENFIGNRAHPPKNSSMLPAPEIHVNSRHSESIIQGKSKNSAPKMHTVLRRSPRNAKFHSCTSVADVADITSDAHDATACMESPIQTKMFSPKISLKDKIKQRMKGNATIQETGNSPFLVREQMRKAVIQKAKEEVEEISKSNTDFDIGPFYGLPSKVQTLLASQRGISKLYEWQDECLKLPAIMSGKNLIYSLPTSGGKTLVAEILILKEILCKKRDALFILPFVSIVQEKVRGMSQFAVDLDFLVEEYAGTKGRFPPLKRRKKKSLYIATIEKAHSLVNSLIEQKQLDSLGLVIVDELHMIGEGGSRGATLESTLVKLMFAHNKLQIVGMSATLNNMEDLQKFLQAEVYFSDFRPVELTEYVKLDDSIFKIHAKSKCPDDQLVFDKRTQFQYDSDMTKADPDQLLGLVMEVIPDYSCLIFCPTKKNCENVAMMLGKLMAKKFHHLSKIKKVERKNLLKELYNDGAGKICPTLQYTVHFGIAYHHSGLTNDERRLIEDSYLEGTLSVLACTSTLAAGVNLPAKRVILRAPYIGQEFMGRSQYKQMVGRAGRAGIDSSGESILIAKKTDIPKLQDLLVGPMESCHSSINFDEGKGVHSLLLSAIGLQLTQTTEEVFDFTEKTLLKVQCQDQTNVVDITQHSLQYLIDQNLVVQKKNLQMNDNKNNYSLEVTSLGRAAFKGSIKLQFAKQLYEDLVKAKESLVLTTYLHLLYLVTPYELTDTVNPSWMIYFQQMNKLTPAEMKVATLIGVPEGYIARRAAGNSSKQKVDNAVVCRFYLTMMLHDLWRQKTLWEVADTFQQPRGFVQNLLNSASSFASCVLHFCQELEEFWAYQDLLGNFVKRLGYCVSQELIVLMEIPGVKLGRARQLYAAGYRALPQIANAEPNQVVGAIKMITKKAATQIISAAKALLNEKSEALMEEIEELVSIPAPIRSTSSPQSQPTSSQLSLTSADFFTSLRSCTDTLESFE